MRGAVSGPAWLRGLPPGVGRCVRAHLPLRPARARGTAQAASLPQRSLPINTQTSGLWLMTKQKTGRLSERPSAAAHKARPQPGVQDSEPTRQGEVWLCARFSRTLSMHACAFLSRTMSGRPLLGESKDAVIRLETSWPGVPSAAFRSSWNPGEHHPSAHRIKTKGRLLTGSDLRRKMCGGTAGSDLLGFHLSSVKGTWEECRAQDPVSQNAGRAKQQHAGLWAPRLGGRGEELQRLRGGPWGKGSGEGPQGAPGAKPPPLPLGQGTRAPQASGAGPPGIPGGAGRRRLPSVRLRLASLAAARRRASGGTDCVCVAEKRLGFGRSLPLGRLNPAPSPICPSRGPRIPGCRQPASSPAAGRATGGEGKWGGGAPPGHGKVRG